MPPAGLATLITALHWRPLQKLPMFFAPVLLFSSYMNIAGFKIDSAGFTAAWSGMYVLLALRRKPASLMKKFTARGAVRGAAIGLGTANTIAGGWAYATGDRAAEKAQRKVWGT